MAISLLVNAEMLTNARHLASTETVPVRLRKKVRSAKTLLGTNQLTPLSEAYDQKIIANLLVTLHSPQTMTLRQIYMPRCTEIEENTEA